MRAREVLQVLYLPGDASGAGFGSAIIRKDGIMYKPGTWTTEWAHESSNFREADNLVTKIEMLVRRREGSWTGSVPAYRQLYL